MTMELTMYQTLFVLRNSFLHLAKVIFWAMEKELAMMVVDVLLKMETMRILMMIGEQLMVKQHQAKHLYQWTVLKLMMKLMFLAELVLIELVAQEPEVLSYRVIEIGIEVGSEIDVKKAL